MTCIAVSYTHLDVYKRQTTQSENCDIKFIQKIMLRCDVSIKPEQKNDNISLIKMYTHKSGLILFF